MSRYNKNRKCKFIIITVVVLLLALSAAIGALEGASQPLLCGDTK